MFESEAQMLHLNNFLDFGNANESFSFGKSDDFNDYSIEEIYQSLLI